MANANEWDGKELVLVLGDLHIPHRAEDIPAQFKDLLTSKLSQVFCTGNLVTKSTEEFVRSLAYNAHIVRGDLDAGLELPDQKIGKIGELSFGLLHGHQLTPWGDSSMLANHARSIGVDVIVHGHSHTAEIQSVDGSGAASKAGAEGASTLLVNPGSITGAYSPFTTQVAPSFCLMAVSGPSVTIYTYELLDGKTVTVTKTEWKKTTASANAKSA